jgi:hypothetical protein
MTKPGLCSRLSTSLSGSNGKRKKDKLKWQRPVQSRRTIAAASWLRYAAAKRKALKAIIMDQSQPMEERFRAQLKLSALPRNSAQDPHSQPLRSDRPSARILSQARHVAYRAA